MQKRSFLVIGLGRFGRSTAEALTELGHEVLAVDQNPELVDDIKDSVLQALQADCTDERVLERLGVRNFDCVIVCIGEDIRASTLITVLCREMGAKTIIAKAQDALHAKLLTKTGADRIIQPEKDAGIRLARSLQSQNIIESLALNDDCSVTELKVPRAWAGKSLIELNARAKYGVSVIAIHHGGQMLLTVDPAAPLHSQDTLVVIGLNAALEKLARL